MSTIGVIGLETMCNRREYCGQAYEYFWSLESYVWTRQEAIQAQILDFSVQPFLNNTWSVENETIRPYFSG